MGVNLRPLALAVMLLALSGCSSSRHVAQAPDDGPSSSAPTARPTLRQIVHDPDATLVAAVLRPGPEGFTVAAWWTLARGNKLYKAIVTSDDRFASAHYEPGSGTRWARYEPSAKKVPVPNLAAFKGLIASPVTSLDPSTRAFVAGGDGATLLPFSVVARSTHGGSWRAHRVPTTHGDQAYDEGDLVLPDGRFLVLLDAWSSDRGPEQPGPEHHGLWITSGADWAHFRPYSPTFTPALVARDAVNGIWAVPGASRQAPNGFVVVVTRRSLLYVSTDGARSFRSIRAR